MPLNLRIGVVNALLFVALAACSSRSEEVASSSDDEGLSAVAACTPKFGPYDAVYGNGSFGEWMGADGHYSITLPNGSVAWFGDDTFLNSGGVVSRSGASLVGNTVGISSCNARGRFSITYDWRLTSSLQRQAFFVPPFLDANVYRYWPAQPWMAGSVLYVPLYLVENLPSGGALGFQVVRTDLAIITNPTAAPGQWSIRYVELVQGAASVAGGALSSADYVYLFNNGVGPGAGDTSLSRLPLGPLAGAPPTVAGYLQTLTTAGWVAGFPANPTYLGIHANSGLSVRYHSASSKWLALYADTSAFPARNVVVATARDLGGPWSQPIPVFAIPDDTPGSPAYNPNHLCYAAYEHFAAAPGTAPASFVDGDPNNELAFTYNCNSFQEAEAVSNLGIYFPRFVRVPMPTLP